MNHESAILDLEHLRGLEWDCWADYHEKAKADPHLRNMRDVFETHVRALDYAITYIKTTASAGN